MGYPFIGTKSNYPQDWSGSDILAKPLLPPRLYGMVWNFWRMFFFWFVTEEILSITAGSDRGSYAKPLSAGCRRYHLTHTPLWYDFCNRRKANFLKFANAKAAATGFEPETRGDPH